MTGSGEFLDYSIIDVFARRPYEGNQLAVVRTRSTVSGELMYSVTREFGYSETTFINAESNLYRPVPVRIFGLNGEMKFAGHPSLGTAFVLRGDSGLKEISLQMHVGVIPVMFEETENGTVCEMKQPDPVFLMEHDPDEVARVIGLKTDRIDSSLPIKTVSTGNRFVVVPLKTLKDIGSVRLGEDAWSYLSDHGDLHFYLITQETVHRESAIHARMIYDRGEDPGTGSAAGPACAYMLRYGLMDSGTRIWIEQGMEMGRPCFIRASGTMKGGIPQDIRVAGNCIKTADGRISIQA